MRPRQLGEGRGIAARSIASLALVACLGASPAGALTDGAVVPVTAAPCTVTGVGWPGPVPYRGGLLVPVFGDDCGAVLLLDGRTGRETRRFTSPRTNLPPQSETPFGAAIALSGRRLLVGALAERTVYALELRTGSVVQRYESPVTRGAGFGRAIVPVGSRLVVSAVTDGFDAPDDRFYGSVHVFDARSGELERSIATPTGEAVLLAFGTSMHAAGSRVAVGTDNARDGLPGRIFLIDPVTGEIASTIATPPARNDDYGGDFAATPTTIAVGIPGGGAPVEGVPGGIVQLFDARDGRLTRTIPSPGGAGEAFGARLAIRGRRLLVLAPATSRATAGRTTAYLFDLRSARLRGRLVLPSEPDPSAGQVGLLSFLPRGFTVTSFVSGPPSQWRLEYRRRLPHQP